MALQIYKIASTEVGSAGASSMDFNSIPQGYTDLKLVISGRETASLPESELKITFNGSATGYSERNIRGSGSAVVSQNFTGVAIQNIFLPGATATANTFGNFEMYVPNYTSANYKSVSIDSVAENNTTAAYQHLVAALWSNTAAISSIKIEDRYGYNFVQYVTATLYGIL